MMMRGMRARDALTALLSAVAIVGCDTNESHTIQVGGCDVALLLYNKRNGSLTLDTRNRGCFQFLEQITVPPRSTAEFTRIVTSADEILSAVPTATDRAFVIHVRFGSGDFRWLFPEPTPWRERVTGATTRSRDARPSLAVRFSVRPPQDPSPAETSSP